MRPLLDWLRHLTRPDRPALARRPDAPRTPRHPVPSASIFECVTCRRRNLNGSAWTAATSPVDTQPIYTVCAECAAKRNAT